MRGPTPHFPALLELLNMKSKQEVVRYSKRLVVHQQDLVALILGVRYGALMPYRYANHFSDKVAVTLYPNAAEREALETNGIGKLHSKNAKKFATKIFQLFDERRVFAAHLFFTPDHRYWHLFYFDNRDITELNNHWKYGPHIHYISDLWPQVRFDQMWAKVQREDATFPNKLHLRYREDEAKSLAPSKLNE